MKVIKIIKIKKNCCIQWRINVYLLGYIFSKRYNVPFFFCCFHDDPSYFLITIWHKTKEQCNHLNTPIRVSLRYVSVMDVDNVIMSGIQSKFRCLLRDMINFSFDFLFVSCIRKSDTLLHDRVLWEFLTKIVNFFPYFI